MEIFNGVITVFDFIVSLLGTITEGIFSCVELLLQILNLINSICKILPSPLYYTLVSFVSVYSSIFIYKLFRKG